MLCEEFIEGIEVTCPVLGEGATARALPVVRIAAPEGKYDYQNKYFTDEVHYLVPSGLAAEEEAGIQRIVLAAYRALDCRGWGRADLMVRAADRKPFLLEMNTSPGMTGHSLVPMSAKAAGIAYEQLCLLLLALARLDALRRARGRPDPMARTAVLAPLPVDVRLTMAGANALIGWCRSCCWPARLWWLARLPMFTVRGITLEGVGAPHRRHAARAGGAQAGRQLLHARPGARARRVRGRALGAPRRGAPRLARSPGGAARGAQGGGAVDRRRRHRPARQQHGEVFEANVGEVEDDDLPRLAGPQGSAARVLAIYSALVPCWRRWTAPSPRSGFLPGGRGASNWTTAS